jgi:hypothetical protein
MEGKVTQSAPSSALRSSSAPAFDVTAPPSVGSLAPFSARPPIPDISGIITSVTTASGAARAASRAVRSAPSAL